LLAFGIPTAAVDAAALLLLMFVAVADNVATPANG